MPAIRSNDPAKTGTAKPLGKPMDTAFASWTADGKHLVLVTRKIRDMDSPPISTLAVMDMEGKVVELRRGGNPVLLADRKTILYEDDDTRVWHTCDLTGGNDKFFCGGLKG